MSKGFHRPENYDPVKDLSGKHWQVWLGSDDWHDATTSVWVDLDARDGLLRVWLKINHPDSVYAGETLQKDLPACKAHAAEVAPLWVKTMKRLRAEADIPLSSDESYFVAALKDEAMRPYVKEHGVDVTRWETKSSEKSAATTVPLTGPEAIAHALERLDPDALEQEMRQIVRSKKVSKRPRAVDVLNTLEGLRRNQLKPADLLISAVPVLPAQFRPFSIVGDTFTPGDANELYRDLFKVRDAYTEAHGELGSEGTREARLHLYDAVRALYGYRDPVEPKTLQRGVSGFLQKVCGVNPKFSYVQKQVLAKPMDTVGRGVIGVDPDLGLDEVGLPKALAWKAYAPYVQARLVQGGMATTDAVRAIRDRTEHAEKALLRETQVRPCVYSRAPSWHRFNVIAGHPRLIDGDTIMINSFVGAGLGGDHDGDTINVHVPSMDEAVQEAHEKLMPSKMVFSDRDYDKAVHLPKHESVLGLATAGYRPAERTHAFPDEASAVSAIRQGKVRLNDEISLPGSVLPGSKNPVPGKLSP